jgi:putative transposase
VRPATAVVCRFITEHRAEFGVAPICRVLKTELGVKIAPRTYYARLGRAPSKRELWEQTLTEILANYYEPDERGRLKPESLYGAVKMWAHLNRQGITVARCTVERLMRRHGWRGVTRSRRIRTTIPNPEAPRAPDLVDRQFKVEGPNQLLVADFTYVPVGGRFVHTAFVIDAYAGTIVGWQVGTRPTAALVEAALADALETRRRQGHPLIEGIHHSDAGTQYTSLSFTERLLEAGLAPSIGSVGDAYDNALAETTIGLYKTECIRPGAPSTPFHDGLDNALEVELATANWVHWYNTSRLMHRLGRKPPLETENEYYDRSHAPQGVTTTR